MDDSRINDPQWHAIGLVVCVAIAYCNGLWGPFQFDDYNVIAHNPAVHSWQRLWDTMPGIRAVLKVTYVANWISGWGALGYHLFNVVVHAINTLLLYALLRRWIPHLASLHPRHSLAALLAALIFALHPAQTEAVTYVSGRSGSLMATFYLLSLWLSDAPLITNRSRLYAMAALLVFAIALATKETAWVLPFAMLLRDRWVYRLHWRAALSRSGLFFMLLVAAAIAVVLVPGYWRLALASLGTRTLGENLITQIDGIWYLITHPLLTLRLNIDPDLEEHSHLSAALITQAAALFALLIIAFVLRARTRWLSFAILWFFVHLLPTNSILPRYDVANDRQLYLALVGPAIMVAIFLGSIRAPILRVTAALAACAVLTAATILRNTNYESQVALWESTARASPNKARVWNNLGFARQQSGDKAGAKAAYDRALQIDPEHENALINRYTLD